MPAPTYGEEAEAHAYLNVMFATVNANNPQEAMTRKQAVSAYTLGSARAERLETQKGTIAPATVSVLTLVGGTIVHGGRR